MCEEEKKFLKSMLIVFMIFGICVFMLAYLAACNPIEKLEDKLGIPQDNIVEETVEYIIEKETGLDIDLTPSSKEK